MTKRKRATSSLLDQIAVVEREHQRALLDLEAYLPGMAEYRRVEMRAEVWEDVLATLRALQSQDVDYHL